MRAQQTALAQLTVVPGTPAPHGNLTPVPTRPAATAVIASSTAPPTNAVTPVAVTETPGLKPLVGGTTYTNPAKTYQIDLPAGWSPPTPDSAKAGRIITHAPNDALTLTIEEGPTPDDWTRLMPSTVAGILDTAYRASTPDNTLQSAMLTGVRGVIDAGLPTYRFLYVGKINGVPVTVERFVTLTFAGAVTITATAAPEAYTPLRPIVEGIVGSLVPLKLDVPTPAALAPTTGGTVTRTPSGLGIVLPSGWTPITPPTAPPNVEFLAQNTSGDQRVRIVRKAVTDSTKLNDFAATVTEELKASASAYEVEAEGMNTIGGARAVRNLYRATIGGKDVVGQSVALLKGLNGYVVSVDVSAAQYDAKPDDAQALFDRIESSITLP